MYDESVIMIKIIKMIRVCHHTNMEGLERMKFLSKLGSILIGLLIFAVFFYVGVSVTQTAPKLAKFVTGINSWEYHVQEQTVVYYQDGSVMGRLGYQKQYSEDFPEFMKESVVAVEDKRFYRHNGLDGKGIGRAIISNLKAGRKAEGGSTITMQLARTLFLSNEKSYSRKVKEVFIASAIEDKYTKDAILNMYLNEVYIGRGCSGMACAAHSYFGKDVFSLNKAEMTMLVGMIQAPEFYGPERNFEGLKQRQETVLQLLVEQEILSPSEADEILHQKVYFKPYQQNPSEHPYYMAYLSAVCEKAIGAQSLYQGGYKIYTTLDKNMQYSAENSVKQNAQSFARRGIEARDIALVSVDPGTGGIRAMVGGVSWDKNQLNMAVLPRQPGSAIKPLYYGAAVDQGVINADTVLNNKKRDFGGGYMPDNYSKSPAKCTAREGLVHSYNVASVEVLDQVGVETAVDYLEKYGVTTVQKGDHNLALGLGGMEKGISPLQLASAYSVFANSGRRADTYTIESIVDANNREVYTNRSGSTKVISSKAARVIDDILRDVVRYGTGTPARIGISSAGKTGTTTDRRDLWYVGYTDQLITAVWVGNSDATPVKGYGAYGGGAVSGPVWRDYMNGLLNKGVFGSKAVVEEPEPEEELPEEEQVEEPTQTEPQPGEGIPGEVPGDEAPVVPEEPVEPENPPQLPPDTTIPPAQ